MAGELGKISRDFFDTHVLGRIGSSRQEIIVPPRNGVDTGIISLGDGRVMAMTTDPIFIDINLGIERAAWFAFHIIASDLCTSGIRPQYLTVDYNLPPEITDQQIDDMLSVIDRECRSYGIGIVTGHTARYAGVNFPMVGGATMMGIGDKENYVTSAMSRIGDRIVVTKSLALEASVLLAHAFPEFIARNCGNDTLSRLRNRFHEMSTVRESMMAIDFGLREKGITSMHDVTEGGLISALFEIAEASGNGLSVDGDILPIYPEISSLCDVFHINPLMSISEGTLLMTIAPGRSGEFVGKLNENGIPAVEIGEVQEKGKGSVIRYSDGREIRIQSHRDEFWDAIANGIKSGIK